MTFDVTTMLYQLANFAILLVLLRIFLYRPVLKVMDERAEMTAAPLLEARRLVAEAEAERAALQHERAVLEQDRAQRLAAVGHEVAELRTRRLEELEREVHAARLAAMESVERGVQQVTERLYGGIASLVVDEVRHALTDLAATELEDQAWSRFADRLLSLPPGQRRELAAAAREHGVRVVTSRALSAEVMVRARATLGEVLEVDPDAPTFVTDPAAVLGVALEAGGMRLDGTAAARLERLETAFTAALRGPTP